MTAPSNSLAAAIEEVQLIVSADGARLDVVDQQADIVHLRLDLADASCADCVLPHDRLVDVIEAALRASTANDAIVVRIDDPREG